MIKSIHIENFKSIKKQNIRLSNLNILAGSNGAGKSSVIQTLLLLKQISKRGEKKYIHLNGKFTQLGTTRSILHKWAKADETKISIKTKNSELFEFTCTPSDNDTIEISSPSTIENNIRYLAANRITPCDIFQFSTDQNDRRDLGINGEYSIAFLSQNIRTPLPIQGLRHINDSETGVAGSYGANVDAWLHDISKDVQVNAIKLPGLNTSQLKFGYNSSDALTEISPTNVGFGITYTLPVVLLLLSSLPGDIVIIENPEAHVHPKGQIALGKLIAQAANAGIQVIVETHSDHLFNGVRLYIKNKKPKFSKYAIHYADRSNNSKDGFQTKFEEIKLTEGGLIKHAPTGFFDDWETAIFELL